MASMKTLADVKRKMTLGSKWRCVQLFEGGQDLGVREIGKVQGNAMAFLKADGKLFHRVSERGAETQVHPLRVRKKIHAK